MREMDVVVVPNLRRGIVGVGLLSEETAPGVMPGAVEFTR